MKVLKLAGDFTKKIWGLITEDDLDSALQTKVNNTAPTGTFKQTLTYNSSNEIITTNVLEVMDDPSEKKVSIFETLNVWKVIRAIAGLSIKADISNQIALLENASSNLIIKQTNTGGTYIVYIDLNDSETTEGTILVRQSDGKFKFKNISNYLGSANGVQVLKLPFNKTTLNESTLSLPVGARLLRMSVKVTTALTGSLSAISLQGSSPLTIASEFADYLQGVGTYNINLIDLPELDSTLAGKLRLSQPGSGTGAGVIYLEYITSMES